MVLVGVGDEDVADPLAVGGGEDGVQMMVLVGAGVDDRDRTFADDIGAGAEKGEGTGVFRQHAANAGRDAFRLSIRRFRNGFLDRAHRPDMAMPGRMRKPPIF